MGQTMDYAAALVYYSILSALPATFALVAVLGVVGEHPGTTDVLLRIIDKAGGGGATDVLREPLDGIVRDARGVSSLLSLGIIVTLWTASRYIGAFMRANNMIYRVDETRHFWTLMPLQVVCTVVAVVLVAIMLFASVLTGRVAEAIGSVGGLGAETVALWDRVRAYVVLGALVFFVCGLYAIGSSRRKPGFAWILPGSLCAVVTWIAASYGFGTYVRNFGSYANTYGGLAGVVIFLVWLWLGNSALLYGAELNAALLRQRDAAPSAGAESGDPAEPS